VIVVLYRNKALRELRGDSRQLATRLKHAWPRPVDEFGDPIPGAIALRATLAGHAFPTLSEEHATIADVPDEG
jgi:hypothetical protein